MKYNYTYKITLLKGRLCNHYYYGQHQTNNLNDNYKGGGSLLRRYYKKYGAIEGDTYLKEILCFYDDLEALNQAEFELIGDKYMNDPMCINMCSGGHKSGYSEDYRNKLSEAKRGKKLTEEHKKKIGESGRGRIVSLETRQKIREGHLGKKVSEESKEKNRKAHLGKKASDETIQKMRASHRKFWDEHPEAHNRNFVSGMKGKHHTTESKEKSRNSHLGKKMSDESKEKNRKAHLGRTPWNKGLTKEQMQEYKNNKKVA